MTSGGNEPVVGQGGAVVEDRDVEVQLQRERRDGLGDMPGARYPQCARRGDRFAVKPVRASGQWDTRDGEVASDAPGRGPLPLSKLGPELLARVLRVGQDQAADLAAAHQAVVPAEVVIEQQVEGRPLPRAQGLDGALLDLGFQATAAERALDAPVSIKQRLGADLLRAGSLDPGDDAQRDWFPAARRLRQSLEDDVLHEPSEDSARRPRSRGRCWEGSHGWATATLDSVDPVWRARPGGRPSASIGCLLILYCSSIVPLFFGPFPPPTHWGSRGSAAASHPAQSRLLWTAQDWLPFKRWPIRLRGSRLEPPYFGCRAFLLARERGFRAS